MNSPTVSAGGGVAGGQLGRDDRPRAAVPGDVVHHQAEVVLRVAGAVEHHPQRPLPGQVEPVPGQLGNQLVHRARRAFPQVQQRYRELVAGRRRVDALPGQLVRAERVAGTQHLVPHHQPTQRRTQRRHVQRSGERQVQADIVGSAGGVQPVQHPHPALAGRQRRGAPVGTAGNPRGAGMLAGEPGAGQPLAQQGGTPLGKIAVHSDSSSPADRPGAIEDHRYWPLHPPAGARSTAATWSSASG
jgi:hypothetical protein